MSELVRVVQGAARLWAAALGLRAGTGDSSHWLSYVVILAVAVGSWLIGQSVVLAINRMHWRGMLFTLVIGVAVLMANAAVSGTLLWMGGAFLLDAGSPGILPLARAVTLATSPLVFSCLSVIPLLGPAIERALQLWALAILASSCLALWHTASPGRAALVLALVAVVHFGLLALAAPRVARLRDRVYQRLTGRPLHASAAYLLELTAS